MIVHSNWLAQRTIFDHAKHSRNLQLFGVIRARDAVRDLSIGRGLEVQVGRGSVDWASLFGILEEKNYRGYITVDRQTDDDPVRQCGESLEFLTRLFD